MRLGQVADVGLHLRVQLGEGGEVVVLHEDFGGAVHEVEVGYVIDTRVEPLAEREAERGDVVLIGAGRGVETGVGAHGHGVDVEDGDVGRKQVVQLEDQLPRVQRFLSAAIEMGIEVAGMHAGVRTAAAHHGDGLAQQRGERLLERELHRGERGLGLPTAVTRSIIGHMDEVACHNSRCKNTKKIKN